MKIVSENRFSGKTYFYTIHPCPQRLVGRHVDHGGRHGQHDGRAEPAPQRGDALCARDFEEGVEGPVEVSRPVVPLAVANLLRRVQSLVCKWSIY